MYFISPFTPVFFRPSRDDTGTESSYLQVFSPRDEIMLQVIARDDTRAIEGDIIELVSGASFPIEWEQWDVGTDDRIYFKLISALPDGIYSVVINGITSEPFRVTSDGAALENTVLIEYTMKSNSQRRDAIFVKDGEQVVFNWRVHGGFKDDDWSFTVDNEQYEDSEHNINDIYSVESTVKSFTLGTSRGCPIWFGEFLNRILCCTYVSFDGERYVRFENSTPQKHKINENRRSYVFTQELFDLKTDVFPSSSAYILGGGGATDVYDEILGGGGAAEVYDDILGGEGAYIY